MKKSVTILFSAIVLLGYVEAQTGPLNDNNFEELIPSTICSYVSGTTIGATQTFQSPFCTGTTDDDVFYFFEVTQSNYIVEVQSGSGFDAVVDAFSFGTVTPLSCKNSTGSGGLETMALSGLTIGDTIGIVVYSHALGGNGTFQICVTQNNTQPPVNDDVDTELVVSSTCNYISGTTVGATQSFSNTTCSGVPDDDVWYVLFATDTIHYVSVQSGSGFDAVVEVVNTKAVLGCANFTGVGGEESFSLTGLQAGDTTYLRVFSATSGGNGTFQICVTGKTAPTCSFSLSATSNSVSSVSATGSFDVTTGTGCSWTATASDSWITITGGISGSGNGTISYSVSANTGASARTGTISVGGKTYTITQSGTTTCTYSLSSSGSSFSSSIGNGSIDVTTGTGCTWTAVSNDSWVTITNGANGSGNGTTSYSLSENTGSSTRTGTITIAGKTFYVTQSGSTSTCTYSISITSNSVSSVSATGSFDVITGTGCSWTATASDSWITITGGISGSGNGTISYSVSANTGASARTGTISVGGKTYTITQSGTTACTYSLSSTGVSVSSGLVTGSFDVTAGSGCVWTSTSSDASWLVITSGKTGAGNGTVSYSLTANTESTSRTGTITVGGQIYTITQSAQLTSVDESVFENLIQLYPNPSTGLFTLKMNTNRTARTISVRVINTFGQEVYAVNESFNGTNFQKEINLVDLAKGIYIFQLKLGDEVSRKTIAIK